MAILEDLKERLSYSLTTASPSLILSQGWQELFKEFFAKGTRDEVYRLLPQEYQPVGLPLDLARQTATQPSQANCDLFQSVPRLETTPTAEHSNVQGSTTTQEPYMTTTACPSPSHGPGSLLQTNHENDVLDTESISKPKLKPSTRVSRAVQAMCDARKRDPDYYDEIWSGFDSVTENTTVEETAMERYRRIRGLQSENENRGNMVKYAQRFSLIIGAQELQVIERGLPSSSCSRGISSRSVAIDKLAEFLQVDRKKILDENKRRSHYVTIFEKLGPGAILLLGEIDGILSLWERQLKSDEVDLICKYAENNLEDWVSHSKKLDEKAASLIVRGLQACGWDGLSHRDTTFMAHLGKYLKGSDHETPEKAKSRKRKSSCTAATPKRQHHARYQIFTDNHMAAPDPETAAGTDDGNADCEDQLDDTLLDWDFDINLSLDWDQFIEDQITEAVAD